MKPDPDSAKAVFTALAKFGVPLQGYTPADFAEPGPFFRMGRAPVGIAFLPKFPGVAFGTAWPRRVEDVVDPVTGLKADIISAEDLIATRLATGGPQNLADVDAIRKAAESQRPKAAKNLPA